MKPISPDALLKAINDRLRLGVHPVQKKENVAAILESETQSTIALWLERVDGEAKNGASPKGGDSVATILESEAKSNTKEWLRRGHHRSHFYETRFQSWTGGTPAWENATSGSNRKS